jgi:hypothetical protein
VVASRLRSAQRPCPLTVLASRQKRPDQPIRVPMTDIQSINAANPILPLGIHISPVQTSDPPHS